MILFLVKISPQNREYMLVQMQTMATGKAPQRFKAPVGYYPGKGQA